MAKTNKEVARIIEAEDEVISDRVEQTNRDLVRANNDLKAEIELHLERAANAMHIMQGELESLETRISTLSW